MPRKLNISSCNVFTCPSNSQLQFSAKCQNPNFGGCGGIWKVYPGSGCLGKSLSFELPHSLYSQPLEYIQNSGIVYYCASTLKETVLNVILKTNKTLNYNYQNPIATFKICFSSHNNLVSVCPFEEKIDLSKIKENGYYINKTFKNSESKSLFTWYLTYEPVGIELFNPTLYGYLIEENGKITGDVFIN